MNLPNKLTVLRVALIPVFLVLFYLPLASGYLWALLVFALASFTDFLDGHLARSRNLVTDFGKFMDPLADKLLVTGAIICLMDIGLVPAIAVIIIISREFLVTSLRLVAAPHGIVIAADKWGKYKTALQMLWICQALLFFGLLQAGLLPQGFAPTAMFVQDTLTILVLIITVISGFNYLYKNRAVLRDM